MVVRNREKFLKHLFLRRHGSDLKAGHLSVTKDGNDIVAQAICDNEQGFVLIDERFAEMR